ncbi:MAG: hypothetical protein BroJett040_10200 [Oligoflexia bacterium]|nr:MAG: hypothetical protein BroJett040_10200 [Oligoflexia bacterium]
MSQPKFRHPKEMSSRKDRVALSTRVLDKTKRLLEKAAEKHKISLSELCSNVLDEYAEWLEKEDEQKKR